MSQVDKSVVRTSFDAAAGYYDSHAVLQRRVASQLIAYAKQMPGIPGRVLDAGSGSGFSTLPLVWAFPDSHIIAVDLSREMLKIARRKSQNPEYVCGDIEALPFPPSIFDLVLSSSVLQWSSDLSATLGSLGRVMTPGAGLIAAIYTAGTLSELQDSWCGVDAFSHTLEFHTLASLRQAFESTKMGVIWHRTYTEVVLYDGVGSLLETLRKTGVRNARQDRYAGLMTPSRLGRMKAYYRARYAVSGKIPASYVVTFIHARLP